MAFVNVFVYHVRTTPHYHHHMPYVFALIFDLPVIHCFRPLFVTIYSITLLALYSKEW